MAQDQAVATGTTEPPAPRPRPTRAESFLGIHHDFHARDIDVPVGANTTPEMVERIITRVRPDYIQTDCKGHHGLSSYPTKVGNPAPNIVGDPLRVWRDVTAEHGVALYVHYSGVVDAKAVELNPEWARLNEFYSEDPSHAVSLFSPYAEELMIPQIKELIDVYDIDGIWVDGDCWGAGRDYSDAALAAFKEETGITDGFLTPADPHYGDFTDWSRDVFRRYLRQYVDELHAYKPGFQIASNWAFSSFMPEPVFAGVDFLSGDSAPITRSYPRFEARVLAHQGRPWDLMTWSFGGGFALEGTPVVGLKSATQLQQEAATIISLGGGYQSVSNQRLDGSIIDWHLDVMHDVAQFCRDRQALSHNAELVPQIALLHAGPDAYPAEGPLFVSIGFVDHALGVLEALLGAQHVVDIRMPHQLAGRLGDYPLIVVPEWRTLPEDFLKELRSYVHDGGNLLAIGPRCAAMFADELDVRFTGAVIEDAVKFLEYDGWLDGRKAAYQPFELGPRATPFGTMYDEFGPTVGGEPAASIATYGAGRIAAIYQDLGTYYRNQTTSIPRKFLSRLVGELFPAPAVEVVGSPFVEVVLARKAGKTVVHLVNTAGQQDNARVYIFDEIPPVGPLDVRLRLDAEPTRVTLEPGGTDLSHTYADGVLTARVPSLDVHRMVVVE